jgi:nicotinamide riboside transporter PnuC
LGRELKMDILKLLEIANLILIVIAVYAISIPKRWGLYFLIIGQFLVMRVFYYKNLYYMIVLMFIVSYFNAMGIYTWKKKGVGK